MREGGGPHLGKARQAGRAAGLVPGSIPWGLTCRISACYHQVLPAAGSVIKCCQLAQAYPKQSKAGCCTEEPVQAGSSDALLRSAAPAISNGKPARAGKAAQARHTRKQARHSHGANFPCPAALLGPRSMPLPNASPQPCWTNRQHSLVAGNHIAQSRPPAVRAGPGGPLPGCSP